MGPFIGQFSCYGILFLRSMSCYWEAFVATPFPSQHYHWSLWESLNMLEKFNKTKTVPCNDACLWESLSAYLSNASKLQNLNFETMTSPVTK